jgi:hypothetical protein
MLSFFFWGVALQMITCPAPFTQGSLFDKPFGFAESFPDAAHSSTGSFLQRKKNPSS